MDLTRLLSKMVEHQASDLYISVGAPPIIKIEGSPMALGSELVTPELAYQMAYSLLNDKQSKSFEKDLELNIGVNLQNIGRFRLNVFKQRGDPALVARYVKSEIPSIEQLGLPEILRELIMEQHGLVLVVGGTGTGKSTSLASMIDYRNSSRPGHILTIEDPIEFVHQHKKSLVNQREVGLDTHSYENALKNALREAPDAIMIGEIRDVDTMKHALAYAETGHLCLATLHANNANQALERILNFFPQAAHRQLLMDMSLHLNAIISQRLASGLDGKRVAIVEVMIKTPYIAELILKGHFDKIKEAMTQTSGRIGQTFDDSLYKAYKAGKIADQEALRLADSRNNLSLKLKLEKGSPSQRTAMKKQVGFDKNASFVNYQSFKVTPIKVSKERRGDMEELLNTALTFAFKQKGYTLNHAFPDVDVQYVLGLKSKEGLTLTPLDDQHDPMTSVPVDTEHEATLVINIVDTKTDKPVWRLTAQTLLSGPLMSQDEANAGIADAMLDFPPT
ncbi:MAG: PilT/PilU family type 4a pilus ATPase [Gammaproteobacteria bacterium]|jgi:twitching motility protein PilU